MSTYFRQTKHPKTGKWERATWIDDYFGRHNYGCRFESGEVFDPRTTELFTKDEPEVSVSLEDDKTPTEVTESAGAHQAIVKEHPNGRRDVTIKVTRLELDENDPDTEKVKEHIEKNVLPKMQEAKVRVAVIHRYSLASTSSTVRLSDVRAYAEFAVKQFQEAHPEAKKEDFIIVEVHEGTMLTRVSTLVNV